jgi:predicted type IV restriction endonuclease
MPAYLNLHDIWRISAEAVHSPTGVHWVMVTFQQDGGATEGPVALTLFMVDAETADRYAAAINSVAMEKV